MAKNKNTPVEMAKAEEGWNDGKRIIPFAELPDKYLQAALIHAERKQLFYFKRTNLFADLIEKLEEEAEKRGIELNHLKGEFTRNNTNYRKKHGKK